MKTVLITGSSRGIGESIARAFFLKGYKPIINYSKDRARAEKLAEELGNAPCVCADVSDPAAVDAMFELAEKRYGGVDVLVNNAGVALPQKVLQSVTDFEFDKIAGVNLKGVFNCCRRAIDGMVARGGGRIINIASVWGEVGGSCEVVYSMTKAGVIGFTKALAAELAPSNIMVNAVSPGFIDTEMNAHLSKEDVAAFAECVPLGRIGTPEEVAAAVLFLADSSASYITGQVIGVNGGYC